MTSSIFRIKSPKMISFILFAFYFTNNDLFNFFFFWFIEIHSRSVFQYVACYYEIGLIEYISKVEYLFFFWVPFTNKIDWRLSDNDDIGSALEWIQMKYKFVYMFCDEHSNMQEKEHSRIKFDLLLNSWLFLCSID